MLDGAGVNRAPGAGPGDRARLHCEGSIGDAVAWVKGPCWHVEVCVETHHLLVR